MTFPCPSSILCSTLENDKRGEQCQRQDIFCILKLVVLINCTDKCSAVHFSEEEKVVDWAVVFSVSVRAVVLVSVLIVNC